MRSSDWKMGGIQMTSLAITPESAKREGLEAISDWRLPEDRVLLHEHLMGLRLASPRIWKRKLMGSEYVTVFLRPVAPKSTEKGKAKLVTPSRSILNRK